MLTTAAQNMHAFLRKSPLCRSHFFEWLKTENYSTACGTVTLKSPLSRESDAPHVHQRPRKHPPRCTLDCGFKTSESPALRGFEAERGPITGTSLYLVLKSNGLHHSKNFPVKFGFSPIDISATIAKKLPPQRCFKTLLIVFFNFSYKRPTFAFAGESGYTHSVSPTESHTAAHAAKQGCFGWELYLYPRTVPHVHQHPRAGYQNGKFCRFWGLVGCSQRTQKAFGTAMRLCASLFRGVAAPLGCVICLQLGDVAVFSLCAQYFLNVRGGGGITTLGAFHTVRKPCVARG